MKQIPTSTYKMSKQLKTLLSGELDAEQKAVFKKLMIDAELTALIKPKTAKAEKAEAATPQQI